MPDNRLTIGHKKPSSQSTILSPIEGYLGGRVKPGVVKSVSEDEDTVVKILVHGSGG